ncbi:unnamed protein product [Linum trigynum]|uniref:Secreted protein n=1 Tax=Linum trigynum TaxID=586398 RepID=A0AAV2CW96_9ROSI
MLLRPLVSVTLFMIWFSMTLVIKRINSRGRISAWVRRAFRNVWIGRFAPNPGLIHFLRLWSNILRTRDRIIMPFFSLINRIVRLVVPYSGLMPAGRIIRRLGLWSTMSGKRRSKVPLCFDFGSA